MRIGWYFARSVAFWYLGLCVLSCALLVAWSSLVPMRSAGLPSPWSLFGPLFLVATAITWSRARKRGEWIAIESSGAGLVGCFPLAFLGVALQAMFAIPPGHMPQTRASQAAVQRSLDGALFLVRKDGGVLMGASGNVRLVDGRPSEFRPAPQNPQRYRRQAFFTTAPRFTPRDALDPWLWRWVYMMFVISGPALLFRARAGWMWGLGALPLLLPLLVL